MTKGDRAGWSLTVKIPGCDRPLYMRIMKFLKKFALMLGALFGFTVVVYWFNLDSKVVKLLEKPMTQHYDNMKRDHRL